MFPAVIDTDTLSEILKQKHPVVATHAAAYLSDHGRFTFSALTRYEVLRGLKEKGMAAAIARFEEFCGHSTILPINDAVLVQAADLWVTARQTGKPRSDADLIIAATALVQGCPLITGNTTHYVWISQLTLGNWRNP